MQSSANDAAGQERGGVDAVLVRRVQERLPARPFPAAVDLARLVGTLQQPLVATNETYNESSAIRLAVSDTFRELLDDHC